mgnify:CR=1 FL=1
METREPEDKSSNGYATTLYVNNYLKGKWMELIYKKIQSKRLDQKTKPNCMLPSGDTSQLQGQI